MFVHRTFLILALVVTAQSVRSQPIVTEILYDPASGEPEWEWIEVFNPGAAPLDLDGYIVDRVGDRIRSESTPPQIRTVIDLGNRITINPTIIPAGGVAVLYNGDGLGWEPERFRNAWPSLPGSIPLIGVDGWSSNALGNSPSPPTVNASLPGLTFGFWSSTASYTSDTADLGTPETPDERVVSVSSASFTFSYDDLDPWPDNNAAASIVYDGTGSVLDGNNWELSEMGVGSTVTSTATFLGDPINGDDVGSPGAVPAGSPSRQLVITEIMYNPESVTGSKEWEWVEVYNSGPAIDFSVSNHWLDDDDGSELDVPNVTSGVIPSGGVGVLFNSSATDLASMQQAWGAGVNLIPVDDWGAFNNTGDVVGLWSNEAAYLADFDLGNTVSGAVAGVIYDDSSPWPSDNGTESIWLTNLSANPLSGGSWARSQGDPEDPNSFTASDVFAPGGVVDNSGQDIGSPGVYSAATPGPLPGDYNGDGVVDAADYVVWRGGGPLLNETASPGVVDSSDYGVWATAYASGTPSTAAPEPVSISLLFLAGCGCIVPLRRV